MIFNLGVFPFLVSFAKVLYFFKHFIISFKKEKKKERLTV